MYDAYYCTVTTGILLTTIYSEYFEFEDFEIDTILKQELKLQSPYNWLNLGVQLVER